MFSLKTSNIMEGSKLGYQAWAIANYLVTTSLKGVSSMKLHSRSGDHAKDRVAFGTPAPRGRPWRLERRVGRNRYPDRERIEGDAVNEIDDFSRPDVDIAVTSIEDACGRAGTDFR